MFGVHYVSNNITFGGRNLWRIKKISFNIFGIYQIIS